MQANSKATWNRACVDATNLSVVTRGDQQICEHQQLVICEFLLVFLPVIVMSATEIREGFLNCHLEMESKNRSLVDTFLILPQPTPTISVSQSASSYFFTHLCINKLVSNSHE